jgi:hypothetical protein
MTSLQKLLRKWLLPSKAAKWQLALENVGSTPFNSAFKVWFEFDRIYQ